MSALKRFSIILLIILFSLSLIDDLSKPQSTHEIQSLDSNRNNGIAHIKVKQGDTVLSITESINNMYELDVEKVIADFEELNPGTTIDTLLPDSFYYFPLYND